MAGAARHESVSPNLRQILSLHMMIAWAPWRPASSCTSLTRYPYSVSQGLSTETIPITS